MAELYEAESKESKMIHLLLDLIEENENEIKRYQDNINNIKQHASDLQTFLAMKQMERNIAEKEEFVTLLLKGHKLNRVSLSCKINNALQNSFNEIKKIGEVIVCTRSSEIEIIRKETQAQIVIVRALSNSIDNILFILQATIDTKLCDIRGCSLLPDGRMIFSSSSRRCVRGFNRDGSLDFYISLHPTLAYDITYIKDSNTLAVTYGSGINQCISIIDVESKKITETIPMESYNDGIACSNNTLFCCAGGRGLRIINLSDKSGKNIVTSKMVRFAYVATFCDKLFYTNLNTNTVTCDLHGTIQWKFEDKNMLTYPLGISVDNDGNVYVVGQVSGNVVVISPDGQRSKQILSDKDGLDKPAVLDYNRTINQLLVANHTGKAFLYNLELK